ncbi:MAG: hypothetical protein H0W72_16460 [Planctomycetes bacterium]|nr:hypothetical protein [Planctomycetota bacterium]
MTPLLAKMRLKDAMAGFISGRPQPIVGLAGIPDGPVAGASYDFGVLFVDSIGDLAKHWPAFQRALPGDQAMWICYPKTSSKVDTDISRDRGWEIVTSAGYQPVAQVAVDATWSAVRFRKGEHIER